MVGMKESEERKERQKKENERKKENKLKRNECGEQKTLKGNINFRKVGHLCSNCFFLHTPKTPTIFRLHKKDFCKKCSDAKTTISFISCYPSSMYLSVNWT